MVAVERDLVKLARAKDTLSPAEVVHRLKNPPRNERADNYAEALAHLRRWEALGMNLSALGQEESPEGFLAKQFPGIEDAKVFKERFPGYGQPEPTGPIPEELL